MNVAKIVSLLSAGAFVAFALIYFNVISDPGKGAYYALGLIALIWIIELSERRRNEAESTERTNR